VAPLAAWVAVGRGVTSQCMTVSIFIYHPSIPFINYTMITRSYPVNRLVDCWGCLDQNYTVHSIFHIFFVYKGH